MEADLDRFYRRDIRDLWRVDEHGLPLLTLRQLWVRIRHGLPRDSALAIDASGGRMPWSIEDHLLADVWEIHANQGRKQRAKWVDHPGRKQAGKKPVVVDDARLARAEARRAARQRKLNGGN